MVGLGPNELRSYKMRTSRWTLLDMKFFKFEFRSTNHLFTDNYSPSRNFHQAMYYHNGSTASGCSFSPLRERENLYIGQSHRVSGSLRDLLITRPAWPRTETPCGWFWAPRAASSARHSESRIRDPLATPSGGSPLLQQRGGFDRTRAREGWGKDLAGQRPPF